MDMRDALDLVRNRLTYKEGWTWTARRDGNWVGYDWSPSETQMVITFDYLVTNSSPRDRDPRPQVIGDRLITVDVSGTEDDVLAQILKSVCDIETHETREFLRVDGEAPFHPHRYQGQNLFNYYYAQGLPTFGY